MSNREWPANRRRNAVLVAGTIIGAVIVGTIFFALGLFLGLHPRAAVLIGGVATAIFVVGIALWALFVHSQVKKEAPWLAVWQGTLLGKAPAGADPGVWLPRLRSSRRRAKLLAIGGPIEFAVFTGLGVFLVVTEPQRWSSWAELLFFAGAGVLIFLQGRSRLRKIDSAIADIVSREGATTPAPRE